jgi:hypothetical protein
MRHFIQFQSTGFLSFELPTRALSGSITGSIYNNNAGITQLSASFTTGSINTTVQTAVSAAAMSLVVAGTIAPVKNHRYLIGVSEEQNGEMITLKSFSVAGGNTTLNLMRPLVFSYAAGEPVADTTVVLTIPTGSTGLVSWNNYAKLEYIASSSLGFAAPFSDSIHKSFDVTRFIPVTTLSVEDLRDFDPQLAKKGMQGLSVYNLMTKAWEMLLARVGARSNMGGIVGSVDLTVPHSYLTRRLIAELDPEMKEHADMLSQRFNEEFESILGVAAIDKNGDGRIQPWERFRQSIKFSRS